MRTSLPASLGLLALSFFPSFSAAQAQEPQAQPQTPSTIPETTTTLDIFAWPVQAASSTPYATVTYKLPSLNSTINPHNPFLPSTGLVRLGFHRPDAPDSWSGIAVPASHLSASREKVIRVWIDDEGAAWHVGFEGLEAGYSASAAGMAEAERKKTSVKKKAKRFETNKADADKGKKNKEQSTVESGGLRVEVRRPAPGPQPVLNKPVVVNKEGKVDEAEPEKSFIQKYWWVLGAFLLMQVVLGGGGDK